MKKHLRAFRRFYRADRIYGSRFGATLTAIRLTWLIRKW